jgi:hypothetical protein
MKQTSIFWDIMLCSLFNGLHRVTSQKTELFITTAVKTSNPIKIKQIKLLSMKGMDNKKMKLPQGIGNPP